MNHKDKTGFTTTRDYILWFKAFIMEIYVYDENFFGNIFIVGGTGYGKTFFTQKLAVNNFFGTFKKVEWVSSIELSTEREAEIESFFV